VGRERSDKVYVCQIELTDDYSVSLRAWCTVLLMPGLLLYALILCNHAAIHG